MRRETRGGVKNAFCSFVLDTYILRHVHDDMHDEKSRKRSEIGVLLRPRVLGVEVALPVAAKVVILVPHRGLDAGDVARAPPEGVRSVALHPS